LKWAAAFAIVIAACGPVVAPGSWPKWSRDTTCDEWMQQMTPDQRSGLAKGILMALTSPHPELAVQGQGDHRSGLLAEAITRSCDPVPRPGMFSGASRISDVAAEQLYVHSNPNQNCEWDSEPRTCDLRP
jgi:hypothetical protein